MSKAIKKEEVQPEVGAVAPRQAECEKELLAVLDKHNYRLEVELVYGKQAILPRLILADTTKETETKDDTKETDKPELTKEG